MTPEEEEQVRRALAAAPPPGPMPAEVAARLDDRLADLLAERASGADGTDAPVVPVGFDDAPVSDLAERRRRRWPGVLVAAALVAVVGVGLGGLLDDLTGGGADFATSERAGDGAAVQEDSAGGAEGGAPPALGPEEPDPQGQVAGERSLVGSGRPVSLHRDTLAGDLRRLRDRVEPLGDALEPTGDNGDTSTTYGRKALTACDLPGTSRGDRLVAARLDGVRGTLVLRRAQDGTHVAEVYACDDGGRLLALTRIPAR